MLTRVGASIRAVGGAAFAATVLAIESVPFSFVKREEAVYHANRWRRVEVVALLAASGVDIATLRWDRLRLPELRFVLFAVGPSQFGALDDERQVRWLRYVLRPRRRLLNALFRARARLDRPPTQPLGTTKPSREELIAHLKTAGRRFAREYWADGLPLFFPDLDLGPVPSEFLHVPK